MSLEVAIEKQVSGFRLDIEFTANSTPLGLLGASGSGKTMTLRTIAGLDKPDRGRIVLHGRVLFDSAHGINVPARERRIAPAGLEGVEQDRRGLRRGEACSDDRRAHRSGWGRPGSIGLR